MKHETKAALPNSWRWVKLGEVCEDVFNRDPAREPEKEFVYVDISSIDNDTKSIVTPKKLIGKEAPSRARQIIRTGDVLISNTRPNLNGVALVGEDLHEQIASTGFCVLRPKSGLLDSTFLFGFVRSEIFVKALTDLVQGALYPAVTAKQVFAQHIPLPPHEEQLKIAAQLHEQLALVEDARLAADAQIGTLKLLPAALLRAAFNGKVQHNMGGGQFELSQEDNSLPNGWRWVLLKDIVSCYSGYWGQDTPSVSTQALQILGVGNVLNEGGLRVEGAATRHLSKNEMDAVCFEGDLMVVKSSGSAANVRSGKTALCPPELSGKIACSNFMLRLSPIRTLVEPYLLWLLLNSELAKGYVLKIVESSTYPNIKWTSFGKMRLPLPGLAEQKVLSQILHQQLTATTEARTTAETQLASLRKLPAALLRQAFEPVVA